MKCLAMFGCLVGSLSLVGSSAPLPTGHAADTIKALWRDPGPIGAKDLFWGTGNAERAPKPPFTFVKEDTSGTKPKIDITDANQVDWRIKLAPLSPDGNEVHAEIAAGRLLWALGYFVDEHYFVPDGRIAGVANLRRAAEVVSMDGRFRVARFERKARDRESRGQWAVERNAFNGTPELSGLWMLTMILGNWDARTANTAIVRVRLPNGDNEDRYLLSDLGTAFGRMAGGLGKAPSRWNLAEYRDGKFVNGVVHGKLEFRYPLMGNRHVAVPVDHARWFADLVAQLTPDQVRRAFEASGASLEEVEGFSTEVLRRFREVRAALEQQ
jgi:hypothetical protein